MTDNNWLKKTEPFKDRCLAERNKFLAAFDHPLQTQEMVFNDILRIAKASSYGREHGIESVNSIDQFTKQIPIRSYENLIPWINREVNEKGGVLSPYPPHRWLKTSGSTGESKKIPYSIYWMANYRVPALGVLYANYIRKTPELLLHENAVLDLQTVREPCKDYLNGIPYQGISNRNPLINESDWQIPWYDEKWFQPADKTYNEKMYHKIRHFIDKDLRAIVTINPSTLVAFKYHFFKNHPTLVKDVHDGTSMGEKLYDKNPELAKKIESIRADESFSFKQFWPNLALISCWTGAATKLYLPQLKKLFPETHILPFMTCGTEGIVTLPIDDHLVTGPLAITQGFYEFLPAEVNLDEIIEKEIPYPTLQFSELEIGKEYHLIMSHANGILRLAIGDIYQVNEFYRGVPRLEFSRRAGTIFSFTGEKITETQATIAMDRLYQKHRLEDSLYICCPAWDEPPKYKFLIELDRELHQDDFRTVLEKDLDYFLCEINEEYKSKRQSNRLGCNEINFIDIGTIERYQETKKGMSAAGVQQKYKPFHNHSQIYDEILKYGS